MYPDLEGVSMYQKNNSFKMNYLYFCDIVICTYVVLKL